MFYTNNITQFLNCSPVKLLFNLEDDFKSHNLLYIRRQKVYYNFSLNNLQVIHQIF